MDPELSAPPVVAVVVARDPGEWFEQCLSALAAQDYPNQSLLVIDRGATALPPRRVAEVLPEAYLRRPPVRSGFAGAANDVLETVQGAAFLLFCRDDVAPERAAVRLMVEEALRSNAGIVGPKVVEWDRPDRLLEVGLAVDKTGAAGSLVERGELDQEQHDAVRDVFAVSTSCMLVRQDLLVTLGGFDAVLGDHGAGIDLCWRAQVAGARVLVAPQARVRQRAETAGVADSDPSDPEAVAATARAHVRTMLKSYSLAHLLRVLPQAALVTAVEALVAVLARRVSHANGLLRGWWWNLHRLGELRRLRRDVRRARRVPDSDVRRLQARGSVRANVFLQRSLHARERARALVEAGENLVESVSKGPARLAGVLLAVLVLAWLVGSRQLLTGPLPAVGELMPFPPPGELFAHWTSAWRATGMGAPGPAPPLFGVLALLGGALLGQVDILQKVLVLGAWPVGALGAWRLSQPLQSPLARVVGVVAYLCVPLPYNALSRGSWSGVVAYAAAPWLLTRVASAFALEPYAAGPSRGEEPGRRVAEVVGLAVVLAVGSLAAPALALALVVATLGMVLGSAAATGPAGVSRALPVVGASLVATLLLLVPWSFELLKPGGWATVTGVAAPGSEGAGFAQLLRFEVGPLGAAPLGWAFAIVAALPLVVGRGWRLAWGARLWCAALACVAVAWAGGRGFLPLRLGSPDVLLAPAAAALAAAAAFGAAAFEIDLRGYRFGWRQAASVAAGAVLALAALPVIAGAGDGRWGLRSETTGRLAWMEAPATSGAYRVLWVGSPAVVPAGSWPGGDIGGRSIAYSTSRDGPPEATELLPGAPSGATRGIAAAVRTATGGGTARLGRLLAPMGIRYIVLPRKAMSRASAGASPTPPDELTRALASQLDLRLLPAEGAVVYENEAWGPVRSLLASDAPELGGTPRPGEGLSAARPVLAGSGPDRYTGPLPDPGRLLVSESAHPGWSLEVGRRRASRQEAAGVNLFEVPTAGRATLEFRTPPVHYLLFALQAAVWLVAARLLLSARASRKR